MEEGALEIKGMSVSRWLNLPQESHRLSRFTGAAVMGAEPIDAETGKRFHFARRTIKGNSNQTSQWIHLLAFLIDLPWGEGQKGRISIQLKCHKAWTGCVVTPLVTSATCLWWPGRFIWRIPGVWVFFLYAVPSYWASVEALQWHPSNFKRLHERLSPRFTVNFRTSLLCW